MTTPYSQEQFMENFHGMEDLAKEIVSDFLDGLNEMTQKIEQSIQNKDFKEIEINAHSLKGALSNFFAEPSKSTAFKLEVIGRDAADFSEVESLFTALQSELIVLRESLTKDYP